jgi:hypothetical protein
MADRPLATTATHGGGITISSELRKDLLAAGD